MSDKKKRVPLYKVGDIIRVLMPCQALNLKTVDGEGEMKKFEVEEVLLVGDEGMVITEVEELDKRGEVLYNVVTQEAEEPKIFSLSEEQITLFE